MNGKLIFSASLLGLLGVALGAFGTHAMKDRLGADLLAVWQTAVQYQLWHALAVLGVALLAQHLPGGRLELAGWLFVAGVVVFSGSLYLMALTGVRALGAVTPVGGVLLILGWALLTWHALRAT